MYELVKNNDIEDITKRALALISEVEGKLNKSGEGEELEQIRVKLSRLGAVIGQFEAKAEYDEQVLDAQRKVQETRAFMNAKHGIEKLSVAEANGYAELEVEQIVKDRNEAHYTYKQLRNLRESVNEMCNAIAGRLHTLRREYQDAK